MDDVAFEYSLTGDGFYDAAFRVGNAELAVRQLGDSPVPLEELMEAALALACQEDLPAQLLWDPEDGSEYRWDLIRRDDLLHIRVSHVEASTPWRSPEQRWGQTALDARCSVKTFCTVIMERATEVLARYGRDQYDKLSLGPFPMELLKSLTEAVARMAR